MNSPTAWVMANCGPGANNTISSIRWGAPAAPNSRWPRSSTPSARPRGRRQQPNCCKASCAPATPVSTAMKSCCGIPRSGPRPSNPSPCLMRRKSWRAWTCPPCAARRGSRPVRPLIRVPVRYGSTPVRAAAASAPTISPRPPPRPAWGPWRRRRCPQGCRPVCRRIWSPCRRSGTCRRLRSATWWKPAPARHGSAQGSATGPMPRSTR